MKYIFCLLMLSSFISADSIIVDTVYTANVNNHVNCEYMGKQNKKCLRDLNIKWQIIEKLIKQKINNKK